MPRSSCVCWRLCRPAATHTTDSRETTAEQNASISVNMPEDLSLSAVVLLGFLLLACQQVLTMEPQDVQEKQVSQAKRRLSLQSTGEPSAAAHPTGSTSAAAPGSAGVLISNWTFFFLIVREKLMRRQISHEQSEVCEASVL